MSDEDFAGAPALLVIFLSNHCPYVRRIETAIGALTSEYAGKGVASVGVCSNDVVNYLADSHQCPFRRLSKPTETWKFRAKTNIFRVLFRPSHTISIFVTIQQNN